MAVNSLDAQKNVLKALETDLGSVYGQQLDALEQRVDAALAAAETALKDCESKASELTNAFVDAVHLVHTTLDQARQAADGVAKTAAAALDETKQNVDGFTKKCEADLAEVQQTLQQLEHAFGQIESEAATAFNGVVGHAQPLVALVTQGSQQLHQHGEELVAHLAQVEHGFADDVKSMASALHDLASHMQTEHQQHDHAQDEQATSTHTSTGQLIAHNISTLTQGMDGIGSAMSVLTQAGEHLGGAFGDGAKGLMSTVGEIAHIVDAIKPVLDVIKAIE